jgi:hypothetical protein
MRLLERLANWFTRSGREETQLQTALDLAKGKQPTEAIAIYNDLLRSSTTSSIIKARALFNRALAYSSLKDDDKAVADLKQLIAMTGIPDNVQSAARTQLVRLRNRS